MISVHVYTAILEVYVIKTKALWIPLIIIYYNMVDGAYSYTEKPIKSK